MQVLRSTSVDLYRFDSIRFFLHLKFCGFISPFHLVSACFGTIGATLLKLMANTSRRLKEHIVIIRFCPSSEDCLHF